MAKRCTWPLRPIGSFFDITSNILYKLCILDLANCIFGKLYYMRFNSKRYRFEKQIGVNNKKKNFLISEFVSLFLYDFLDF